VFQNKQFCYCFGQHAYDPEPGTFNGTIDLTLNSSEDYLFITENHNDRVQVFTPTGQFLKVLCNFSGIPFLKLQGPVGIYYTPDGHLLSSSCDNDCVLVFKEDGMFVSAIEGVIYQGRERFNDPAGVMMTDNGQIADMSSTCKLVVF